MLKQRGRIWYIRRRVPTRFHAIEPQWDFWLSLHTDSETIAQQKAGIIWQEQLNAWEARMLGADEDAASRSEAARDLAQVRGLRYLPTKKVAELPRQDLLERIEAIKETADRVEVEALLGAAEEPKIKLSKVLDIYWGLTGDRILEKTPDQVRRWRNPRVKAINNLLSVIGDKPIAEISGDDMLEFRDWWLERMRENGLTPNSANKDLGHIADVLKTVNRMKRLGLVLPLTDLAFKNGHKAQRHAFSTVWIKDRLLAPHALDGLASSASVSTVDRGVVGPVFISSTVVRLRHFDTVLGLMPNSRLNCASEACDHSGPPSDQWRVGPHYCGSDRVPSPAGSNLWRRTGSIVALP